MEQDTSNVEVIGPFFLQKVPGETPQAVEYPPDGPLPPEIYLAIEARKKYWIATQEAWGAGFCTTNPQMTDRFRIESITFTVRQLHGNSAEVDSHTNTNESAVTARTSYTGTDAIGDFTAMFTVEGFDSRYGGRLTPFTKVMRP